MPTIKTIGELKRWLDENEVSDDTGLWVGETTVQGGLDYFSDVRKYDAEVDLHGEVFGTALPPQRRRRETGVVIW